MLITVIIIIIIIIMIIVILRVRMPKDFHIVFLITITAMVGDVMIHS